LIGKIDLDLIGQRKTWTTGSELVRWIGWLAGPPGLHRGLKYMSEWR